MWLFVAYLHDGGKYISGIGGMSGALHIMLS